MKKVLIAVVMAALFAGIVQAQETKYASSATAASPALTFGPGQGQTVVTAVSASTDVSLGGLKFYARDLKFAPTTAGGAAATNIWITNTGIALTNSDKVVYMHKDGTTAYRTISAATETNVVLSSALAVTCATGDYLYKIIQVGQIVVGANTTAAGTNASLNLAGDAIFATPADSPLYVTLDSATNSALQVTVRK